MPKGSEHNNLLPIFMKIENSPVLVVGGGHVAFQKIKQLINCHAVVTVVSPKINEAIIELFDNSEINWENQSYSSDNINGFEIIIGATDDEKINTQIYNDAKGIGIPVNIVDQPELCSFYMGAIHQDGPLKIAVSTNGMSPAVCRQVRDRISESLPQNIVAIIESLGQIRKDIKSDLPSQTDRAQLLNMMAEKEFNDLKRYPVKIVGAGPGDPELISIKGARALVKADMVIYDSLVHPDLLKLADKSELIFVGKRCGKQTESQETINQLLVDNAKTGKRIVRLKGGDPFIFGRGGEELMTLAENKIMFEIIPGVTAGIGSASSNVIPLTHREVSSSVQFITGHCKNDQQNVDWKNISDYTGTLVFYMGVKNAEEISTQLIKHGKDPATPTAIIQHATLQFEKFILSSLQDFPRDIDKYNISSPSIFIVGDVVNLHHALAEFQVKDTYFNPNISHPEDEFHHIPIDTHPAE